MWNLCSNFLQKSYSDGSKNYQQSYGFLVEKRIQETFFHHINTFQICSLLLLTSTVECAGRHMFEMMPIQIFQVDINAYATVPSLQWINRNQIFRLKCHRFFFRNIHFTLSDSSIWYHHPHPKLISVHQPQCYSRITSIKTPDSTVCCRSLIYVKPR